jgi:hypothetical protein
VTRALATGVLVLHLAFVLFVVLGGILAVRWPRVAWVHLPAAGWGAWVEFAGWLCPLTPLENALRRQAGLARYESGFVEQYLLPILYPAALTRELQWGLGASVLLVNVVIYAWALRVRARRSGRV